MDGAVHYDTAMCGAVRRITVISSVVMCRDRTAPHLTALHGTAPYNQIQPKSAVRCGHVRGRAAYYGAVKCRCVLCGTIVGHSIPELTRISYIKYFIITSNKS
jgi:hypothetical protein